MSMRELDRLKVIEAIIEGRLKPAAAAQRLRLTTRQVHRLVLRYREDGPAGLTSRRRGQPSNRQLSPGLENRAISLIRRNYSDFGPTLAQEKLVECHGLKLAKETVRQIMVDAGMWVPRKQRPPKVYQPRNRRACCGELIQIDGSDHRWFEDRGPACTLLVFIEARRVSQRLTVQYDKVLYLLADTPQSRRLAGDHVEIYHYPDGRIEPRVDGTALPFTTYDKLCEIDQGAIVENKRLGHVLQVAQLVQAQRDSRRSQSVPRNPRQSTQGKMLSKKAQRELMPEDIAAALDNTPPSRRSRHA
ncbi:helix-turn-helix domain-containing protein [Pseudomonas aeruginosa]|uniref:helix-turn-helix domain-containing protein n=1 Tax=Pseudomonas aeruginosa TaxID=287 RepID=UPI003A0FE475